MSTTPRFSLPMYLPPAPFALADTVACAALVDIAYTQYVQWHNQGLPPKRSFVWKPPNNGYTYSAPLFWTMTWNSRSYDEPFGFVAVNANRDAYLVFRGTVSDADWAQDALSVQTTYQIVPNYGLVHLGFYQIYQVLSPQILTAITALNSTTPFKRFFFTGHSLGCGLSSLAVPDVITNTSVKPGNITVQHHILASPRVGDPQYAYMMNKNGVPTYRIVNTEDAVPQLPPAVFVYDLYKHIGIPVDFTAQYDSDGDNHAHDTCYQYAVTHPTNPEGPIPPPPPLALAPRTGVRLALDGQLTRLGPALAEVTVTPK